MNAASLTGFIGLMILLILLAFPTASPALYIIGGVGFFVGLLKTTPNQDQKSDSSDKFER